MRAANSASERHQDREIQSSNQRPALKPKPAPKSFEKPAPPKFPKPEAACQLPADSLEQLQKMNKVSNASHPQTMSLSKIDMIRMVSGWRDMKLLTKIVSVGCVQAAPAVEVCVNLSASSFAGKEPASKQTRWRCIQTPHKMFRSVPASALWPDLFQRWRKRQTDR